MLETKLDRHVVDFVPVFAVANNLAADNLEVLVGFRSSSSTHSESKRDSISASVRISLMAGSPHDSRIAYCNQLFVDHYLAHAARWKRSISASLANEGASRWRGLLRQRIWIAKSRAR